MKIVLWIQVMTVAGVLFIASCAQNDTHTAVEVGDQAVLMPAVRSPHDLMTMMSTFTGGLGIADSQIAAVYTDSFEALPWTGSINFNSAKVMKEIVAIHCKRAREVAANKALVYGTFRDGIAPRDVATNALIHSAGEKKILIQNLWVRATGNRPSDEDVAAAMEGFDGFLSLVPNTAAGTQTAAQLMCTAIAGSALAAIGF